MVIEFNRNYKREFRMGEFTTQITEKTRDQRE